MGCLTRCVGVWDAVENGGELTVTVAVIGLEGLPMEKAVFQGSLERVNAILMTALTSALGMLPLAIARGAGNEILQPLAIVVLGGLFTSTALTLLVIPALYVRFGRWFKPTPTHRQLRAELGNDEPP